MRQVAERDFSRIVQAFALAAIDPSQWLNALEMTSDVTGAECSALEYVDLNTGAASMESSFRLEGSVLREYEERILKINPRVSRGMTLPVGFIGDDRHLTGWGEDPNAPEFLAWLAKTPNFYIQGGKILHADGHIAFFASHYGRSHGPPGVDQELFHRRLMPHVINMHEAARALSANKLRNELVTHENLDSEKPFALLDLAGRVVECSRSFEPALQSGGLLALYDRQLISRRQRHRRLVEQFLSTAVGADRYINPPLPIRLTGGGQVRGLILRAIPLPPREDIFDIFRPAALVTLTNLDVPTKARRQELVALFGLTTREADVAAMIGEGHSIEQAASSLGISRFTVKQHLKPIFGKMCIERQSDLVAIVARLI